MSKRIKKVKHERVKKLVKMGKKHKTKMYSQCARCGRTRGVLRDFGICRICFRELAHQGKLPGVVKSSW